MTIQDTKYLKLNSRENSLKIHLPFNYTKRNKNYIDENFNIFTSSISLNYSDLIEDKNGFVISNVFTIHILDAFFIDNVSLTIYAMDVYANDIKMDSISINSNRNLNITGKEYEKKLLNPLAKVTELTFKLKYYSNANIENSTLNGNVCILIRNYEPQTEFNDNYNELNPQYNPNIIMYDEDSSSDEES